VNGEIILAIGSMFIGVLCLVVSIRNAALHYRISQLRQEIESFKRLKKEYELYIEGVKPEMQIVYRQSPTCKNCNKIYTFT